jgi:hypothetical protein
MLRAVSRAWKLRRGGCELGLFLEVPSRYMSVLAPGILEW